MHLIVFIKKNQNTNESKTKTSIIIEANKINKKAYCHKCGKRLQGNINKEICYSCYKALPIDKRPLPIDKKPVIKNI